MSPLVTLATVNPTSLGDVADQELTLSLEATGLAIGSKVSISEIAVTSGTWFRIRINSGELVLSTVLSGVPCSPNLVVLQNTMTEKVTVQDIGGGTAGLLYSVTGTPYNSGGTTAPCNDPKFKFTILSSF